MLLLLSTTLVLADALNELQADAAEVKLKGNGSGIVGVIAQGAKQASFSTSLELDAQTPFEIGSVTKVFTSVLLSVAVEEQKLALEDPIGVQLQSSPWMRKPSRPKTAAITYRQLSTHHSGLGRMPPNLGTLALLLNGSDPYAKYDTKKLAKGVAKAKPNESKMAYSNFGAGLLGQLVSDKLELDYCAAVEQKIAVPMGLTSLSCADPENLATPHVWTGEAISPWHFDSLVGAGGLRSNATDLATFLQHFYDSARAPELNAVLQRTVQPHSDSTGLGWMRRDKDGVICLWHNGQTGGSSSFVGVCPELELAVVLLMNESLLEQDLTMVGIGALKRATETLRPVKQTVPAVDPEVEAATNAFEPSESAPTQPADLPESVLESEEVKGPNE